MHIGRKRVKVAKTYVGSAGGIGNTVVTAESAKDSKSTEISKYEYFPVAPEEKLFASACHPKLRGKNAVGVERLAILKARAFGLYMCTGAFHPLLGEAFAYVYNKYDVDGIKMGVAEDAVGFWEFSTMRFTRDPALPSVDALRRAYTGDSSQLLKTMGAMTIAEFESKSKAKKTVKTAIVPTKVKSSWYDESDGAKTDVSSLLLDLGVAMPVETAAAVSNLSLTATIDRKAVEAPDSKSVGAPLKHPMVAAAALVRREANAAKRAKLAQRALGKKAGRTAKGAAKSAVDTSDDEDEYPSEDDDADSGGSTDSDVPEPPARREDSDQDEVSDKRVARDDETERESRKRLEQGDDD